MKKVLSFASTFVVLVMLALSSVTANADSPCTPNPDGTTTCTMNLHGASMPVGPPQPSTCLPPDAAGLAYNINAVMHFTINKAGDFWATGTDEGDVTLTVPSTGVVYTGHFTIWFGASTNKRNFVQNETFNAQLIGSDGSTLSAHLAVGFGVSASGQPIMHLSSVC